MKVKVDEVPELPLSVKLIALALLLLSGCSVALPVVAASSYVAGQVVAAHMP